MSRHELLALLAIVVFALATRSASMHAAEPDAPAAGIAVQAIARS